MRASRLVEFAAGIALTGAGITYFGIRGSMDSLDLSYANERLLRGEGRLTDYTDLAAVVIPCLGVFGIALYDTYRVHRASHNESLTRKPKKT